MGSLILVSLLSSVALAEETPFDYGLDKFRTATRLKDEGSEDILLIRSTFLEAASTFTRLWTEGHTSTEVATNAANAYYFAERLGEAVLFYRRALALDPSNQEATAGLNAVRATQPVQPPTGSSDSLADALFFWHAPRLLWIRAWCFYLLFPAAWLLFALEISRGRTKLSSALLVLVFPAALLAFAIEYLFRIKRPFATVGVLCLIPALACLTSILIESADNPSTREAVLMLAVEGRNGNGDSYGASHEDADGKALAFPAGTEVDIIESRSAAGGQDSEWLEVRLIDQSTTWVPSSAVVRVHETPRESQD